MRVFNVPPSARFLHTVIEALVDGKLVEGFSARDNHDRLADVTLYLPTRRAGRLVRDIFLDVLKTDAVLLPRIVTLSSVDEDELEFAKAETAEFPSLDIPPALDGLPRRLTLARLVAQWASHLTPQDATAAPLLASGPASILALADDLARLIDDMTTRGVDWRAYDGLVPEEHDEYWNHTLNFLQIARKFWPDHLAEIGRIEAATRRDKLIAAEADRLMAHQRGPVIAAGSTGSMPATATFLNAIAKLPLGAVVLPGIDMSLEEEAWKSIGGTTDADGKMPNCSHPQFALHHLITNVFRISRRDIETIGTPAQNGREILASEAMRPSDSSGQWHTRLKQPHIESAVVRGMNGLTIIEAANPEMEALAIAIAMREAHESNTPTALVTPDRALARRVIASLSRWNLDVDDSGGDSLMDTQAGIFARLAVAVVAEDFAPATLLALLKHPLLRLGETENAYRTAIGHLELSLLRGPRPPSGSAGLAQEFSNVRKELGKLKKNEPSAIHRSERRAMLDDVQLDDIDHLIGRIRLAVQPLESLEANKLYDFVEIGKCHRLVIAELSRDHRGDIQAFQGADGKALADSFDELLDGDPVPESGLQCRVADYGDVFQTAFAGNIVRRPPSPSALLRIYGLLEARLTETDRVILGGLVEGVWPPQSRIDPWLSRPMRQQLGLDLPERRIGLTAHDFVQLLGAPEVILTHAAKVGGAPAVASRFLHRLEAVAGDELWDTAKQRGDDYVRYATDIDHPAKVIPAPQPAPRPKLELRPLRMSATEIEDLFRDPYSVYAKHVLKLFPLDPVDMPLTAADRGSSIHEALGEFTKRHGKSLPSDTVDLLRRYGEKHFAPLMERAEARALWWPRYLRIASWFAQWETTRREGITNIDAETRGQLKIKLSGTREFVLSARADRIEHRADGDYAIIDYKTGSPPSGKQVRLGLAPQLSLEAAILRAGGYDGIAKDSSVIEFRYVHLTGNVPAGKADPLMLALLRDKSDAISPDQAAAEALHELETRLKRFEDEAQGYPSLSLPMWKNRYGAYDDLARIKEWSVIGGRGGGEE